MDVKLSLLDKFLLDIILCPFSVLLDLICSCVEEDYFYIFFLLQLLYFVSYLIDLCLSMNILSYAFFKKFYSFTIAYMIYFSFEYSVQSFFLFFFFLSFFLFFFLITGIQFLVKSPPAMQETWFNSWIRKSPWRRDRLPTPVFLGGSAGKESTCNAGDLDSISGLGGSSGGGKSYTLQDSGLENSMEYIVHGVTKSWTQLSNFHLPVVTVPFNTHELFGCAS